MFRLFAICAALLVSACDGGFEAIKPDPNQIISIRNEKLGETKPEIDTAEPRPLPMLPPLETQPAPFVQPAPDTAPISPRGIEQPLGPQPLGIPQQVNPNDPPYRPIGKLFYKLNGRSWSCSAELVGNTGDVLMTAAHCVYDNETKTWGSNFQFLVGYDNGSYRQSFDWQCSAIFTGWPQRQWAKDYAFIKLRGTAPESLGLRVGLPTNNWASVGYPSNYASGQRLHRVEGSRGVVANGTVQMVGNPFGTGSSGGAWVDGAYAIGLNSFGRTGETNSLWGPLFDGRTTQLYEYVRRGCQDDVIPLGANPKIAAYDKKKTYIEVVTNRVEYGPRVVSRRTAACSCANAEEIFLENGESESYIADLAYVGTVDDPPKIVSSDSLQIRSDSKKQESLGCTRGDMSGNNCPINLRFELVSAAKLVPFKEPTNNPRQEPASTYQAVTPGFCADQCLNNPNGGYCLEFGTGAKPILLPLAGFVTETLDKTPKPNGVTTTVKELITAFKGDPNAEDPCQRSDFYRVGDNVRNEGISCMATSPDITGLPQEARISLRTRPVGEAKRVSPTGATGSAAQFTARETSPLLEFHGQNTDEINRRFGGFVTNVERRSGKLIVTTENGCSIGDDK